MKIFRGIFWVVFLVVLSQTMLYSQNHPVLIVSKQQSYHRLPFLQPVHWFLKLFTPFTFPAEARLYPKVQQKAYYLQKEQLRYQKQESQNLKLSLYTSEAYRLPYQFHTIPGAYLSFFQAKSERLQTFDYSHTESDYGLEIVGHLRKRLPGTFPEFQQYLQTRMIFTYKLTSHLPLDNRQLQLNAILQLSEFHQTKTTGSTKNKTNLWTKTARAISPGIRLRAKNFMLEGSIHMPIETPTSHQTSFEAYIKDKEIKGSLGMKWFLPEYIEP